MRQFTYRDAKSHKFWNIELQGNSFTVTYGRIGAKGQTLTKTFPTEEKARKEHDKLVKEKLAKGYVETAIAVATGPAPAAGGPMRSALEGAIFANPDDLASHAAYADWLAEQGDPRGEFIQVQLALEDAAKSPAERKKLRQRETELLNRHARDWLGALAPFLLDQQDVHVSYVAHDKGYHFQFARGWVETLQVFQLTPAFSDEFNRNPIFRLLRNLSIREQDYDDPGLPALADSPHLTHLRRFQLGPDPEDSSHISGEAADALIEKMPRLEELRLFAHQVNLERVFALPLAHLRTLYVYHLHAYPLEVLAANKTLRDLRHLSLWPHMLEPGDEDPYITQTSSRALVTSRNLPALTHLELYCSALGDAGCEDLVRSGILKRLKVLDISRGTVTDAGAELLAACPDLRRLERLAIGQNNLTAAGVAALQAAFPKVETELQHQAGEEYLWEGDME
jgi:uncharacterized protein (TIGR02996 family)